MAMHVLTTATYEGAQFVQEAQNFATTPPPDDIFVGTYRIVRVEIVKTQLSANSIISVLINTASGPIS